MKKLLPLFTGPSRYLGTEPGTVRKDPDAVRARLALAFPDLYEVGMSYLGQKILYAAVNAREDLWAERVFAPDHDVARVLSERGEPLCTLESDTPLSAMHAVAFHITHELCYTNILYMLDLGGIPLESAARGEHDPIVMAGGGCTFNAEPVAPFLDLMVLGDGEEILPEVMGRIADGREAGTPRAELVASLRDIPGVYVPALFAPVDGATPTPLVPGYERVEKRIVADLDACDFPTRHITPFAGAVHDRLAVEIARGCTRGCRFCQAGIIYRPARERSPETLDRIIERGLAETGYEDLSFLSLSTGDYSGLEELFTRSFERCSAEQVAISLPSLRVGSVSERIMGLMASIRRTGATLAPEAGSQRLRDVINKGITEEALVEHVQKLFAHGWQQVKLYFMLGLPTETDADMEAILDLCLKVRDCAGPGIKRLQVTAAVSPFVPKPHTPFQWERQLGMDEVRARVDLLRELFRPYKRLKLRWHMPEMSWLEGVFSRGDRRLAPVVRRAYEKGALFASWKDHLDLAPWREALAEEGIDPEPFLGARDPEGSLPWDHLSSGVTKRFLLTERSRALDAKLTDDCRYNACRNCGVCNFDGRASELSRQAGTLDIRPRVARETRDQADATGGSGHQTAAELPAAPAAPAPQAPAKSQGGRPKPPDIGELSDKAGHFRVWHTKVGELRFLSQIELQSLLERIMRRARIPVSFSAGFHPLPRVSFGRALPVGVASEAEWFNLFVRKPMDPLELGRALDPHLPLGFGLLRVETLPLGKKQPQAVAEDFRLEYLDGPDEAARRMEQWRAALALETMPWTRMTKKGERTTDVRPMLASAEPQGDAAAALRLDWGAQYVSPLRLVELVHPGLGPERFLLTKVRQWMESPEEAD
ncbi:TIGR03960 family B12-binding radical SAM protein [Desulfocurvus sp. DL9XJH121]